MNARNVIGIAAAVLLAACSGGREEGSAPAADSATATVQAPALDSAAGMDGSMPGMQHDSMGGTRHDSAGAGHDSMPGMSHGAGATPGADHAGHAGAAAPAAGNTHAAHGGTGQEPGRKAAHGAGHGQVGAAAHDGGRHAAAAEAAGHRGGGAHDGAGAERHAPVPGGEHVAHGGAPRAGEPHTGHTATAVPEDHAAHGAASGAMGARPAAPAVTSADRKLLKLGAELVRDAAVQRRIQQDSALRRAWLDPGVRHAVGVEP